MDALFDPDVAAVLSLLEGGPRDAASLSAELGVGPGDISGRLSYLVERGYVSRSPGEPPVYAADAEKLARAMEDDENYQSAVDGLAKLDSYLN